MKFLTLDNVVKLNRRHSKKNKTFYVEPDNLRNRDSLEWVLEAIQYPLFGVDPYPSLADKAAVLAWTIIQGHVFHDGNKRTGMSALDIYIRWNGYYLDASNNEVVEIALLIAGKTPGRNYTLEEFTQWIKDKLIQRNKGQK